MKITKTEVCGFMSAMRAMRNPMNSWYLNDSFEGMTNEFILGDNDKNLAQRLINSGNEHMKFLRTVQVWADFDMTRFFWSEMDTYKFNSKNSCSTIHKLLNPKNEITMDMFDFYGEDADVVIPIVIRLNEIRELFLSTKVFEEQRVLKRRAKTLLLEGFLQLRTVNTNYAELRNIMLQRKNHQMKEDWQECMCHWITTLPYAKELIFCGYEDDFNRLQELGGNK